MCALSTARLGRSRASRSGTSAGTACVRRRVRRLSQASVRHAGSTCVRGNRDPAKAPYRRAPRHEGRPPGRRGTMCMRDASPLRRLSSLRTLPRRCSADPHHQYSPVTDQPRTNHPRAGRATRRPGMRPPGRCRAKPPQPQSTPMQRTWPRPGVVHESCAPSISRRGRP